MVAINRRAASLGLVAALFSACRSGTPQTKSTTSSFHTDDDIRRILRIRVDEQRQSRGIAVGLVGNGFQRTVSHGVLDVESGHPVDADSVFPIASMTKLFTALVLADAVIRREVAFDDPLARHLPALKLQSAGRPITLLDLMTHTAGFPPYPDDYPPETDPVAQAKYGHDRFYAALASQKLLSPPGTQWSYSDIGPQLVADALASRTGTKFETLLEQRVLAPLKMKSTTFDPTAMKSRVARPHDLRLRAMDPHVDSATPASTSLYSSVADLQRFVSAWMGVTRSPLARPMALMSHTRFPAPRLQGEQAIGVQIWRYGQQEVFGHNGNLPGAASAMLWRSDLGVIVLSNAAPPVGDIASHLLEPRIPLATPMKVTDIDVSTLRRYVGRYKERTIGVVFAVALEGDALTFEAIGQAPKIGMSAEQENVFTIPRLRARVEFKSADVVTVRLLGNEYVADRM